MKYLMMFMAGESMAGKFTAVLVLAALLMTGAASAAELFTVDHPFYQGTMPGQRDLPGITQNLNTTLIEPVQVACGAAGAYTTQNWYLRRFYLRADHGINLPWTVSYVDFGVEQLAMADGSTPPPYNIQVKIFSIPSASPFTFAAMGAPIGTATVTVTDANVGTIMTAAIVGAAPVNPADHDLVVAIDAPDGSTIGAGLQFRPAANSEGARWDAYLATTDCGVADPVAVSDIGFPDSQTIFVVYGGGMIDPPPPPTSVDEVDPIAGGRTEHSSWGQVKALYR